MERDDISCHEEINGSLGVIGKLLDAIPVLAASLVQLTEKVEDLEKTMKWMAGKVE